MTQPFIRRFAWIIPLLALVVAALACGPPGIASTAEVPAQPTGGSGAAGPTATPQEEDKEAPPTAVPPTNTPAPTATPQPQGMSASNVGGLTELDGWEVDPLALLAASASPTSHLVATFGADATVRVFDPETGDLYHELGGHGNSGFALAFSPDGQMVASGAGDFRVKVWDVNSGTEISSTIVNADPYRVTWSHDSSVVAVVGAESNKLTFIDPQSGEIIVERQPGERVLWSAAFSPDSTWIATSDNVGTMTVYNTDTLEIIAQDTTATGAGWDLEFSPNGDLVATCNDGGGVYIWETATWTTALSGQVFPGDCTDGVFSPDATVYFAGGDDGSVLAYDTASGDLLAEVNLGVRIWTLDITGDGELLVAAMDDGTLRVLGLP